MKKILVGLLSTILCGCSQSATMFPVQGPLAQQRPIPVIEAVADGITGNTGNIRFTMPNGADCTGKWSSVAPQMVALNSGSLFGQFGTITGFSVSAANQPGTNRGQALAICSDGNQVDFEFVTGSGTANGFGIARDSSGNIFKVLF